MHNNGVEKQQSTDRSRLYGLVASCLTGLALLSGCVVMVTPQSAAPTGAVKNESKAADAKDKRVTTVCGPWQPELRPSAAYILTATASPGTGTLTVAVKHLQGWDNWPFGIRGITLFQGATWMALDEVPGSRLPGAVWAQRTAPSGDAAFILPIGGQATYAISGMPKALDLAAPFTTISVSSTRYDCKQVH